MKHNTCLNINALTRQLGVAVTQVLIRFCGSQGGKFVHLKVNSKGKEQKNLSLKPLKMQNKNPIIKNAGHKSQGTVWN